MKLEDCFDLAIIGEDYNSGKLIYSWDKLLEIVMKNFKLDYISAIEYIEFNLIGYRSQGEPIFLIDHIEEQ